MAIDIPNELKVFSFKDFCIRCEDIYDYFWEQYAPFFDIVEYRDYLLFIVKFNERKLEQDRLAGVCWEFLMGDIDTETLFEILEKTRHLT